MKCTIKTIAEELNLSRNTVAKVLNKKEGVSEKTKKLVLDKARELNYRSALSKNCEPAISPSTDSILLLTRASVNYSVFWINVMKGIESVLAQHHYSLNIGIMDDNDMHTLTLPANIHSSSVKGIILVEICDIRVCQAILKLDLPTVTVDMPREYRDLFGKIDIVTMENKSHIQRLTQELIKRGFQRFAFAGDLYSSNVGSGFQERYDALCDTLKENRLNLDLECSLLTETDQQFMNSNYLVNRIKKMKHLPDIFICGNDWTAIQIMHAAQFLGYIIPKDFSIMGFDNIAESEHTFPPLTTISTPKEQLGIAAATCIINRIQNPDTPYVYSQYMTTLIPRKSIDYKRTENR